MVPKLLNIFLYYSLPWLYTNTLDIAHAIFFRFLLHINHHFRCDWILFCWIILPFLSKDKNVQICVKPTQIMILWYTNNIFPNNLQDLKVPKGGGGSRRGSLNPEAAGDGGEGETEVSIDIS